MTRETADGTQKPRRQRPDVQGEEDSRIARKEDQRRRSHHERRSDRDGDGTRDMDSSKDATERHRHRDRHRRRSRETGRSSRRSISRSPRRQSNRKELADGPERDHERDRKRRRTRDDGDAERRRRRYDDGDSEKPRERSPSQSRVRRGGPLPSQEDSFAITNGEEPEKPKEKPNYGNSGILAAASNSIAQADGSTVTLKYHEPAEARKPSPRDQWKLFIFKGKDLLDTIDLSARSCWLVGKDAAIADLPAEHPSVSKQHAVIQFRYIEKRNEFGDKLGRVKPYLIDLESANGTVLNDSKVPESRYLELRNKDMVQFGHSTREYVVMLAPRD